MWVEDNEKKKNLLRFCVPVLAVKYALIYHGHKEDGK